MKSKNEEKKGEPAPTSGEKGEKNQRYEMGEERMSEEKIKIARPTQNARKFLMARVRGQTENKDNHFWIDVRSGEIKSSGYLQGNGDYFVNLPQEAYEIGVSYEPFLSYARLDEYIDAGIEYWKEEQRFNKTKLN